MKKLLVTSAALLALLGVAMGAGEKPPADHVQWMKHLGAANGAIRKGVDVEKNANAMVEEMKGVTTFAASDAAGVSAGMKMIGAGCKGCHDVHREKISDTENLIK